MLQDGEEEWLASCVQCGIVQQVKTLAWITASHTVKQNQTNHKAATSHKIKHDNKHKSYILSNHFYRYNRAVKNRLINRLIVKNCSVSFILIHYKLD